ncbi:hypothetical protein L1987_32629 [Smallanthus sonchifolius]|uniref:Uncharacterized protein n=1 Tax=Smallanthus sonchifolius TaxID=185202 RepID=A0ACB9HPZ1_9ASTR|nr:hypothetical protein L1987_32629 [Smallanthus sonchifolius]
MSNSGKRGSAKCKKKFIDAKNVTIEFNEDGLAIGTNASCFMSMVGLEFRTRIPYHELAKDVDKKLYDEVWNNIKQTWNIPNDHAKGYSAEKNYEPARVGRTGFSGFMSVWEGPSTGRRGASDRSYNDLLEIECAMKLLHDSYCNETITWYLNYAF